MDMIGVKLTLGRNVNVMVATMDWARPLNGSDHTSGEL